MFVRDHVQRASSSSLNLVVRQKSVIKQFKKIEMLEIEGLNR